MFLDQPFKQWYEIAYSQYCSPYMSGGTGKENLSKYEDILSFDDHFLYSHWMFEQVVMWREILVLSLLGLKSAPNPKIFLC